MTKWKPEEIIVNARVKDDPVTEHLLQSCKGVPVKYVEDGKTNTIVNASEALKGTEAMLEKILTGKKVLYISPAGNDVVDVFTMPYDRMMSPHVDPLKLASNGCFYECDWCYLKRTHRAAFLFIKIKAQYDRIKQLLTKGSTRAKAPSYSTPGRWRTPWH